jgi:cysteine desulfurase / selenocysteine lyase
MSDIDWQAVRAEFPSLQGRTFLNTATFGQLPQDSKEASFAHFDRRERTAGLDFLEWFDDLNGTRALIARLIHCSPDDIAFLPNAGYALSLAASSIDWKAGDEMLTLHHEFPNQLYGHASVGARGVECDWPEFEAHVSERTRMVALSTVNYTTGLRPDLGRFVRDLRKRGIVVYLDGTQSAGALEFDCASMSPDFFAVDAYKWMISPNGATFVYVNPSMRKLLTPNVLGWRSDKDWRNVTSLHHGSPRFGETAEKYEPGMLPFASLYGMDASLRLIEEIGIPRIEKRVLELAGQLRSELAGMGAEFYESKGECLPSQIVTANLPGVDSAELARKLAEQNINISARRAYLRISPHFYNNNEDVAVLLAAIRKLR